MASTHPKKKTKSGGDLDRPWEAGDSIPAPEAIHGDGESAWALWHQVSKQHEQRFADTAPLTRPPGLSREDAQWAATQPAGGAVLGVAKKAVQPIFTLETAMLIARRNNRVCPRPQRWDAFMQLLPPRKTLRGMQRPPVPATGGAWAVTPSLTKRLCFREQIEWAEHAGVLAAAMDFMQSMSEEEWLHMGED
jgi:hypothetical protein